MCTYYLTNRSIVIKMFTHPEIKLFKCSPTRFMYITFMYLILYRHFLHKTKNTTVFRRYYLNEKIILVNNLVAIG